MLVYSDKRDAAHERLVTADGAGYVVMEGERGQRGFFIILDAFQRAPADTQWFMLVDDDTLLFLAPLAALLQSLCPSAPHYIGGLTEDPVGLSRHVEMAYGGGGVLLSRETLERIQPSAPRCMHDFYYLYGGDEKLAKCILEAGIFFTPHRGFHQLDLRGDASGYVEGVVSRQPIISLHHLPALQPLYGPNTSVEQGAATLYSAHRVLGARLLQRVYGHLSVASLPAAESLRAETTSGSSSIRGHADLLNITVAITAGYSVKVWPGTRPLSDFSQAEQTWQPWVKSRKEGSVVGVATRPAESKDAYCEYHWAGAAAPEEYTLTAQAPQGAWPSTVSAADGLDDDDPDRRRRNSLAAAAAGGSQSKGAPSRRRRQLRCAPRVRVVQETACHEGRRPLCAGELLQSGGDAGDGDGVLLLKLNWKKHTSSHASTLSPSSNGGCRHHLRLRATAL